MGKQVTVSTGGLAVLFLLLTFFGGHASAQSITQKFRIINHVELTMSLVHIKLPQDASLGGALPNEAL
jgi:hypothetical protein